MDAPVAPTAADLDPHTAGLVLLVLAVVALCAMAVAEARGRWDGRL